MSEELSLFRNMQQGDVSALEYFFQEYADLLYYRALGYVHHSQVAEDVVQEVFIRFWDNRAKLDISVSVAAYLTRSVVNGCRNYLEHRSVRNRYEQEFQSKERSLIPRNWRACGRDSGLLWTVCRKNAGRFLYWLVWRD